ncbi:hypothetical protein [Paenibacillus oryzisoli]|uniref:Uncharacterized protein n=1 Tax=Paenibacillus oryzisoli TaxID=1850517 RepID=A0A198AD77_9BACL|nr:hypothetical protein [Paenibacillus oryzisoli]OAS18908.1 hypothetical protein A8708_32175 [Paenibacillus oryzisoli]
MTKIDVMKKCTKCKEEKKFKDFIEKNSHCLDCRRDYQKQYKARKRLEDLAIYQLKSSAKNVYKRGQKNYIISPYENVSCGWNRIKEIVDDLSNDKKWMGDWRNQTAIFEKTGDNSDKPSIGRVGDIGNYTRDNIIVQSLKEGSIQANAKPCYMLEIRDKQFGNVKEFASIKDVKEYLKSVGVPVNACNNINTGKVHNLGNGLSIIIQTQNGTPQEYETAQYSIKVVHSKYLIDNTRGINDLLERKEHIIPINSLGLSFKRIQVGNQASA